MRSRRVQFRLWTVSLTVAISACDTRQLAPPQTQFQPLEALLQQSDDAVVRLYVTPFPVIELIAVHPWFVVRRAGEATASRWEVWPTAKGDFGHVRRDMRPLEEDIGANGGVFVWAELVGPEAVAVADFIVNESPNYPCRGTYDYFPGPNSNTYAQWILRQSQWDVVLPESAIGMDFPVDCP